MTAVPALELRLHATDASASAPRCRRRPARSPAARRRSSVARGAVAGQVGVAARGTANLPGTACLQQGALPPSRRAAIANPVTLVVTMVCKVVAAVCMAPLDVMDAAEGAFT